MKIKLVFSAMSFTCLLESIPETKGCIVPFYYEDLVLLFLNEEEYLPAHSRVMYKRFLERLGLKLFTSPLDVIQIYEVSVRCGGDIDMEFLGYGAVGIYPNVTPKKILSDKSKFIENLFIEDFNTDRRVKIINKSCSIKESYVRFLSVPDLKVSHEEYTEVSKMHVSVDDVNVQLKYKGLMCFQPPSFGVNRLYKFSMMARKINFMSILSTDNFSFSMSQNNIQFLFKLFDVVIIPIRKIVNHEGYVAFMRTGEVFLEHDQDIVSSLFKHLEHL